MTLKLLKLEKKLLWISLCSHNVSDSSKDRSMEMRNASNILLKSLPKNETHHSIIEKLIHKQRNSNKHFSLDMHYYNNIPFLIVTVIDDVIYNSTKESTILQNSVSEQEIIPLSILEATQILEYNDLTTKALARR